MSSVPRSPSDSCALCNIYIVTFLLQHDALSLCNTFLPEDWELGFSLGDTCGQCSVRPCQQGDQFSKFLRCMLTQQFTVKEGTLYCQSEIKLCYVYLFIHTEMYLLLNTSTKVTPKLPTIIIAHNYPLIQELNCAGSPFRPPCFIYIDHITWHTGANFTTWASPSFYQTPAIANRL